MIFLDFFADRKSISNWTKQSIVKRISDSFAELFSTKAQTHIEIRNESDRVL